MMLKSIRSRLGRKLFLSYMLVILIGAGVLFAAVEFALPRAYERHIRAMETMMGDNRGMTERGQGVMAENLFINFLAAVNESIALAMSAALVVAIGVSVVISRRIAAPVQ